MSSWGWGEITYPFSNFIERHWKVKYLHINFPFWIMFLCWRHIYIYMCVCVCVTLKRLRNLHARNIVRRYTHLCLSESISIYSVSWNKNHSTHCHRLKALYKRSGGCRYFSLTHLPLVPHIHVHLVQKWSDSFCDGKIRYSLLMYRLEMLYVA